MNTNAISSAVHHLERHPPATLGLHSRSRLRDLLREGIQSHERMRAKQPEAAWAELDEAFAADLAQVRDALLQVEDSLANDPDPVGEPVRGTDDAGRPTDTSWTAGQVAAMQPFYAAYVRAHDGTVPAHRNDIAARWIDARRQEFFAETREAPVPLWDYDREPLTAGRFPAEGHRSTDSSAGP